MSINNEKFRDDNEAKQAFKKSMAAVKAAEEQMENDLGKLQTLRQQTKLWTELHAIGGAWPKVRTEGVGDPETDFGALLKKHVCPDTYYNNMILKDAEKEFANNLITYMETSKGNAAQIEEATTSTTKANKTNIETEEVKIH